MSRLPQIRHASTRALALAAACAMALAATVPLTADAADDPGTRPVEVRAAGSEIREVAPLPDVEPADATPEVDVPAPRPDAYEARTAREPVRVVAAGSAITEVGAVFQRGEASWYGPGFAGRTTANGETYDPSQLTAAHRTLPFGTRVRVTNERNGRSVIVRINDRGPYAGGRIIDLSEAAAGVIGMRSSGVAPVILEIVG